MPSVLGLDIGGANLKAAHVTGSARLRPFPLWKHPDLLPEALRQLLRTLPSADTLAVTMTGELCDCFETKRQGVGAILDAVTAVAEGRPVRVWRTDGRLADTGAARAEPLLTAAANWHALATYAGRFAPHGPALLIDVGSTTTDLIPLQDGRPVPQGLTDTDRLRSGELVYTGVRRTPVCALLGSRVAAELFATTLDVYLLLEVFPEDATTDTADGRPATRALAHARLARMLCGDTETCDLGTARRLAVDAVAEQTQRLRQALLRVTGRLPAPPARVILAGSGEFLARWALEKEREQIGEVLSLAERLGPELSQAACAYAVAVLASEESRA